MKRITAIAINPVHSDTQPDTQPDTQLNTNDVDNIDLIPLPSWQPKKPRLTLEHVAACLMRHYTPYQIAKLSEVCPQAVYQFIERNIDVLQPLIDNTDTLLSTKLKRIGLEIANSIDLADIKKATLMQKVTAMGIIFDKYKLVQSQSKGDDTKDIVIHIHNNLFNKVESNHSNNLESTHSKSLDTIPNNKVDTIDIKVLTKPE